MSSRRRRLFSLLVTAALVAASCGGDDSSADIGDPAAIEWEQHVPGGDCQCGDGGEFSFYSRTADPERVVLFFQGGGACFSLETCDPEDPAYLTVASGLQATDSNAGVFAFDNPDNPFRDWSFVFVPYCTGDIHIGDNVNTYGPGVTVNHKGFVNSSAALDHLVESFPDAGEVVVTGSSAGGPPSPLFGALVSDELPDADITVLADGSGVYGDNPPVNEAIGGLWGTFDNVPDWEVNEGLEPADWSLPGLFVQAGLHDPDIRFARYDNAYDDVQQSFSSLAGLDTGDLLEIIQANEAGIEAGGVEVASYIAPGTDHTILGENAMYSLEVEGVSFLDWLTDYVAGDDVPDVACTDCENPAG